MNVENLARIWTSNLVRRDDVNNIMMPSSNLEAINALKFNVCADSDVLTDIIKMVPEIYGYVQPTLDIDQFINENKTRFLLHNVGPKDDSSLPRCNTLSDLNSGELKHFYLVFFDKMQLSIKLRVDETKLQ